MVVEPISSPRNTGIFFLRLCNAFTSLSSGKCVLISSNLGADKKENAPFSVMDLSSSRSGLLAIPNSLAWRATPSAPTEVECLGTMSSGK